MLQVQILLKETYFTNSISSGFRGMSDSPGALAMRKLLMQSLGECD